MIFNVLPCKRLDYHDHAFLSSPICHATQAAGSDFNFISPTLSGLAVLPVADSLHSSGLGRIVLWRSNACFLHLPWFGTGVCAERYVGKHRNQEKNKLSLDNYLGAIALPVRRSKTQLTITNTFCRHVLVHMKFLLLQATQASAPV